MASQIGISFGYSINVVSAGILMENFTKLMTLIGLFFGGAACRIDVCSQKNHKIVFVGK